RRRHPPGQDVAEERPRAVGTRVAMDRGEHRLQHVGELDAERAVDHRRNGQRHEKGVGLPAETERRQNQGVEAEAGQHADAPADTMPVLRSSLRLSWTLLTGLDLPSGLSPGTRRWNQAKTSRYVRSTQRRRSRTRSSTNTVTTITTSTPTLIASPSAWLRSQA